jgi:Kef-type K+ transport system membrane component KefB
VAFVLSKILSLLGASTGNSTGSGLGASIGRTIGVTVGLGVLAIPLAKFVLGPLYLRFYPRCRSALGDGFSVFLLTCMCVGMIAAAGYAGTSTLYGAYLGGLIVSHLDGLEITDAEDGSEKTYAPTFQTQPTTSTPATVLAGSHELSSMSHNPIHRSTSLPPCLKSHDLSSTDVTSSPRSCPTLLSSFEIYIAPLLNFLLLPLFFGSIGYSIPFIPLWKGKIIWKGIIYALLMLVSKAVCGVCIWVWTVNSRAMRGKRASQRFKESFWAGSMVGCAMIARGEIGLLSALFIISRLLSLTTSPPTGSHKSPTTLPTRCCRKMNFSSQRGPSFYAQSSARWVWDGSLTGGVVTSSAVAGIKSARVLRVTALDGSDKQRHPSMSHSRPCAVQLVAH